MNNICSFMKTFNECHLNILNQQMNLNCEYLFRFSTQSENGSKKKSGITDRCHSLARQSRYVTLTLGHDSQIAFHYHIQRYIHKDRSESFAWRKLNFYLILKLFRILYSWLDKMSNYSAIVENIHLKHAFFTFIFVLKSRINIAKDTMNTIQILFLINMHLFIGLLLHILLPTTIISILIKHKNL